MGNILETAQQCAFSRTKPFSPVIPLAGQSNQKPMVLKYLDQALKGCGRMSCTNLYCASSFSLKPLNKGLGLKTALKAHLKQAELCQPVETTNASQPLTLLNSPPAEIPILALTAEQYVKNTGVEADFADILNAYIQTGETKEEASMLVALLFATDSDESKGHEQSMYQLARLYMEGIGVELDAQQAVKWFMTSGLRQDQAISEVARNIEILAYNGNKSACRQMAIMFRYGLGVPTISYKQAINWLVKAGASELEAAREVFTWFLDDSNIPNAKSILLLQLSVMYSLGVGTSIDNNIALGIAVKQAMPFDNQLSNVERAKEDYKILAAKVSNTFKNHAFTATKRSDTFTSNNEEDNNNNNNNNEDHDNEKSAVTSFARASTQNIFMSNSQQITSNIKPANTITGVPTFSTKNQISLSVFTRPTTAMPPGSSVTEDTQVMKDNMTTDVFKLAVMCTNGYGCKIKHDLALVAFGLMGYSPTFAQRFVYDRLNYKSQQGEVQAMVELAFMHLNHKKAMKHIFQDTQAVDFQQEAARLLATAANMGDKRAISKLAECYVHGIGVPIDFKIAAEFYTQAGKSREFMRGKFDAKMDELKLKYRQLFDSLDTDHDGFIDKPTFREFYILCLQAKGFGAVSAAETSDGMYQNKTRWEIVYKQIDSRKAALSFDDMWSSIETRHNMFALEDQANTAFQFFMKHLPAPPALVKDSMPKSKSGDLITATPRSTSFKRSRTISSGSALNHMHSPRGSVKGSLSPNAKSSTSSNGNKGSTSPRSPPSARRPSQRF